MASDEPQLNHKVVDLLYDDELDDESRQAARRQVDASEEASEQLAQFDALLDHIRQVDVDDEDIPDGVHDSIMAAARDHADDAVTHQARAESRTPSASPQTTGQTLWSRLLSSGAARAALAASVVAVAGFVIIRSFRQTASSKFMQADNEVASQVTFGGGPAEPTAANEPVDQPTSAMSATGPGADESGEAADQKPAYARAQAVAEQPVAEEPTAEPDKSSSGEGGQQRGTPSGLGKIAQLEDKTGRASAKRKHRSRTSRHRRRKSEADKDRKLRFDKSSAQNKSANDDKFAASHPAKKRARRPKMAESTPKPAREPASRAADSTDLGKATAGIIGEAGTASADDTRPESAPSGAAGTAKTTDAEASPVGDIEASYAGGNYADVVDRADRYLASSGDQPADGARVLELKARAQAQQGDRRQADRTYADLQREYPSYKPDKIQRRRADLADARARESRKARRKPESRSPSKKADEAKAADKRLDSAKSY